MDWENPLYTYNKVVSNKKIRNPSGLYKIEVISDKGKDKYVGQAENLYERLHDYNRNLRNLKQGGEYSRKVHRCLLWAMENGHTINITFTFCSVEKAKELERKLIKDPSYNLNGRKRWDPPEPPLLQS